MRNKQYTIVNETDNSIYVAGMMGDMHALAARKHATRAVMGKNTRIRNPKSETNSKNKNLNFQNRHGGWMLVELTVAAGLLGMLLGVWAAGTRVCGRANHRNWVRQKCVAACEGQLDSIAVRGEAISAAEIERLWEGIAVDVERRDGTGDWAGLELVKVRAVGRSGGREVAVQMGRYLVNEK